MRKFFISVILFLSILFSSSCSPSYSFEEQSTYYVGIVRFEEFHENLVVDIPSIGLCTIPNTKKIYYLDDDTQLQAGDLIKIKFNEDESNMAIAESYPAQFIGIAEYISVTSKNLAVERTEQGFLFSQPTANTANETVVDELYYFIETGGYNGQMYIQLFCTAVIVEISETTTKMKLQFEGEDSLAKFLSYYPSLEQSNFWKF